MDKSPMWKMCLFEVVLVVDKVFEYKFLKLYY